MKNFDHFELAPNKKRILACGIDERGQAHKTPLFRLSGIQTDGNRVTVFDDDKPTFFLETSEKDDARQKCEELIAFINKHFRDSLSFRAP